MLSNPSYRIVNAQIVTDGAITEGEVVVRDGLIERIAGDTSGEEVGEVIDAGGALLLPGVIDDQVHFREPGLTHKADIRTESRAAVAGGVTTYFEMPNVSPPTTNADALEDKYQRAATKSSANFGFYLGGTNDNLDDIKALDPTTAAGVKVFMGSSTGNMLVDDEAVLDGIFAHAPCLIATHCEDTPTIDANYRAAQARWGDNPPPNMHAIVRSEEACWKSSSLAVELARRHNSRLHVLHLTTAKELSHFTAGPADDKRITAEVCLHHLWFCDEDYPRLGTRIHCNPAIKRRADRDALRQALADNVLDVIATDHAPHTKEEKAQGPWKSPSGLPLVQFHLLGLLDLASEMGWSLPFVVEKACSAPGRLYQVDRRGAIREGWWADLVLVEPNGSTTVKPEIIESKCGWSPFEGHTFSNRIAWTMVNGHLVYRDGVIDDDYRGQRVTFDR